MIYPSGSSFISGKFFSVGLGWGFLVYLFDAIFVVSETRKPFDVDLFADVKRDDFLYNSGLGFIHYGSCGCSQDFMWREGEFQNFSIFFIAAFFSGETLITWLLTLVMKNLTFSMILIMLGKQS